MSHKALWNSCTKKSILREAILREAGASEALLQLLQDMNRRTWMALDGSPAITETFKGARPGEATADLIFMFLLARVTKEVREAI